MPQIDIYTFYSILVSFLSIYTCAIFLFPLYYGLIFIKDKQAKIEKLQMLYLFQQQIKTS